MFRYYVQYWEEEKKRGEGKVELLSETRGKRTGERTKFDHMAKKGGMIVSSHCTSWHLLTLCGAKMEKKKKKNKVMYIINLVLLLLSSRFFLLVEYVDI